MLPMTTNNPSPPGDLLTESLHLLAAAHYVLAFVTALLTPAGLYLAFVGWGLLHPSAEQPGRPNLARSC